MNTPNKITFTRIVLIVSLLIALLVISLIPGYVAPLVGNSQINWVYLAAFIVFVIAASTDALDGYLARKNHQVTDLGKFLDPVADKLLVNSMLIFLCSRWDFAPNQNTLVPVFCVIAMVVRDLVVDGIRFVAAQKNEVIAANIFGKLKTVFQMIAIPAIMLNDWPFSYFDNVWDSNWKISLILIYLATAMSLISGVIYVVQNSHVLKEKKK